MKSQMTESRPGGEVRRLGGHRSRRMVCAGEQAVAAEQVGERQHAEARADTTAETRGDS